MCGVQDLSHARAAFEGQEVDVGSQFNCCSNTSGSNVSLTLVLTLPQSFYVFQGWSLQLSQLHFPYLPSEGLGLREWMSALSRSLHEGEESSQH